MESGNYQTTDLNLGAALRAAGARFVKAERLSHRTVAFIFSPVETCEEMANKFWNGTLTVSAKDFADQQRNLKDILFAKLRDGNGETKWKTTSTPTGDE